MEKESKTIKCRDAVLVIIIFTILGVVIGYAVRKQEKIECPKSVVNINEVMDGIESDSVSKSYEIEKKEDKYIIVEKEIKNFYDVEDLNVKEMSNYPVFSDISDNTNIVEEIDNGNEYSALLDIAGHVTIKNYKGDNSSKEKLNINKVLDIVEFSVPAVDEEQLLYMLTEDGSVYFYKYGSSDNKNYEVTKVDNVSNVKKLFISSYSKMDAGGSWALFAITDNNDCIMINGAGV